MLDKEYSHLAKCCLNALVCTNVKVIVFSPSGRGAEYILRVPLRQFNRQQSTLRYGDIVESKPKAGQEHWDILGGSGFHNELSQLVQKIEWDSR